MTRPRANQLAEQLSMEMGEPLAAAVNLRACSGGCIHRAEVLTLADGRRLFVKSSRNAASMFECESDGLLALRAASAATAGECSLRVPGVIWSGLLCGDDCLVLECIDEGPIAASFFHRLGTALALLHKSSVSERHGWHSPNYIGTSPQVNEWSASWSEFFAICRIEPQLKLARKRDVGNAELFQRGSRLISRLPTLLATDPEAACLLHGDLWRGNILADETGMPVIFDPAVYYGNREAELAMPLLFGGFEPAFFDGYNATMQLQDGWKDRVELYKLYHLLNHLNLFGAGYLESCLRILRRFT